MNFVTPQFNSLIHEPMLLQAQPSPTTGKFSFVANVNGRSSTLISETSDKNKEDFFEDINSSSFAFKPVAGLGSFPHGVSNKVGAE